MILLTGATGFAGSFITDEFVRERVPVRILVRNRAKAEGLERAPTVQIVEGDMSRPSSLEWALDGVGPHDLRPSHGYGQNAKHVYRCGQGVSHSYRQSGLVR